MGPYKDFPASPYAIFDAALRWSFGNGTMTIVEVRV